MKINVLGVSFPLTEPIETHARTKVGLSLAPAVSRVESVSVRLSDINGNHGGQDKCCRILVSMRKSPDVIVDAVASDLYAAIDFAASRVSTAVRKRMQRKITLRKKTRARVLPS